MIYRGITVFNFVIASSALSFQVFVLHPWHLKLEREFDKLREENIRALRESEKERLTELKAIRVMLLEQSKARLAAQRWWWAAAVRNDPAVVLGDSTA